MKEILSARGLPFKTLRHAEKALEKYPDYVLEKRTIGYVGIPKGKQKTKEVICPSCGGAYFALTENYNPDINANPAMIDMKPQYKEWGWPDLPKDASLGYGILECPECGAALAPNGKLKVK